MNDTMLQDELTAHSTVYLVKKRLNKHHVQLISQFILSEEALSMKQLFLEDNSEIGDEGGADLSIALSSSPYCKLELLSLAGTGIGVKTIKELSHHETSQLHYLRSLDLHNNMNIGDEGGEILISTLAHTTHHILDLNLSMTGIGVRTISAIAKLFTESSYASSLKSLKLWGNSNIDDEGGEILCSSLYESPYCKIEHLYLAQTGIGLKTIKGIGDMLSDINTCCSSSLKTLVLDGNISIGDKEVAILSSALAYNTSLTELYLHGCSIGNVGANCILNTLDNYNSSIQWISLNNNIKMKDDLRKRVYSAVKYKYRRITSSPAPYIRFTTKPTINILPSSTHSPPPSPQNHNNNNINNNINITSPSHLQNRGRRVERKIESKIISNFKRMIKGNKWKVDVDYSLVTQLRSSGSYNLGVYHINAHNQDYIGNCALKIVRSIISINERSQMEENTRPTNHVRALQYNEYWIPASISHPLIIQYINYWINSISDHHEISSFPAIQDCNQYLDGTDASITPKTSFLVMPLCSTTLSSYFIHLHSSFQFDEKRKWKETSFLIFQILEVITHLHRCYVIHGDIRGDNFLVKLRSSHPLHAKFSQSVNNNNNDNNNISDKNDDDDESGMNLPQICLSDFGLAKCECQLKRMNDIQTLIAEKNQLNQNYLPPEVSNRSLASSFANHKCVWEYFKSVDIWSAGKMIAELFDIQFEMNNDFQSSELNMLIRDCSSLLPPFKCVLYRLLQTDAEQRCNDLSSAYLLSGLLCWVFTITTSSHNNNSNNNKSNIINNNECYNDYIDNNATKLLYLPSNEVELNSILIEIDNLIERKLAEAEKFLSDSPYSQRVDKFLEFKFFSLITSLTSEELKNLISEISFIDI